MEIQCIASGSTGNCYLVSDGKTRLILEAGIQVEKVQVACGYSLTSYTACLISHCHGDHAQYAGKLLKKGIDIYASRGTLDACSLVGHRTHPVMSREQYTIGSWICMGFDVFHDAPEPLGFLLLSTETNEKLLYFTDARSLPYRFAGVTHMLAECNYDNETLLKSVEDGITPVEAVARICSSHMGLETLLAILAANDLSSLVSLHLIHLSSRHANEQRIKRAVQRATGVEVIVC